MSGKKPTHNLRIKERMAHGERAARKGTIGAGWQNEDGSFTISLNPGVVLSWSDDVHLGLFPRTDGGDDV